MTLRTRALVGSDTRELSCTTRLTAARDNPQASAMSFRVTRLMAVLLCPMRYGSNKSMLARSTNARTALRRGVRGSHGRGYLLQQGLPVHGFGRSLPDDRAPAH